MNPEGKAANAPPSFPLGMDQHGANRPQPDSDPSGPDLHGPPARRVPLHQPADLSRDRHQSAPGCEGMAGPSGPGLRHHRLGDPGEGVQQRRAESACQPDGRVAGGGWRPASSPPPAPLKPLAAPSLISTGATLDTHLVSRGHKRYSDFAHYFRKVFSP